MFSPSPAGRILSYPPPAETEVFPTEIKLNSKSEDLSIKNTGLFLHKGEQRRVLTDRGNGMTRRSCHFQKTIILFFMSGQLDATAPLHILPNQIKSKAF
jgi:hypothetical protein